jgi:hypothetical protein
MKHILITHLNNGRSDPQAKCIKNRSLNKMIRHLNLPIEDESTYLWIRLKADYYKQAEPGLIKLFDGRRKNQAHYFGEAISIPVVLINEDDMRAIINLYGAYEYTLMMLKPLVEQAFPVLLPKLNTYLTFS